MENGEKSLTEKYLPTLEETLENNVLEFWQPRCLDEEQGGFVWDVDREVGEWHSGVTEDLEAVGPKGAAYKGAYHDGRALLKCIDELEAMAAE
jgi:mannose/cellobiose epimerase-like protein (N-acyl-D-glucosamine 2-epimerase family)